LIEACLEKSDTVPVRLKNSPSMGQGCRVAVHCQDTASAAALQEEEGVAASANGTVQIDPVPLKPQEVHDLPAQDRLVVPFVSVSVIHGASFRRRLTASAGS
jgi:hypothetical protein